MTDLYQSYFGLDAAPFSIAPDPRFLFMSQQHQEALATLLYGMGREGGFVVLTGEVGAGKTTICRCLLGQVPEGCDVAYIFNPKLTVLELLSTICDEFRIPYPPGTTSIKRYVDLINAYLLDSHARSRHAVLIIDEAQNLSATVLEQMRLLTNLETDERKLLQIILIGQPELVDMLAQQRLLPLAQRIVARYHLSPLSKEEVVKYVKHRLEVSGAQRQLFPNSLFGKLHQLSGGVPRIINLLCDRALLGAFVQGKDKVDHGTLIQAAREAHIYPPVQRNLARGVFFPGLVLALGSALAVAAYQMVQVRDREMTTPVKLASLSRALTATPVISNKLLPASAVQGDHEVTLPVQKSVAMPIASRVAAAKVETSALDILKLPPGMQAVNSRSIAYDELLQAWGGEDFGPDPCRQAENMGLQCSTSRGGMDDLRQLNVPAVLHLKDELGHRFYATLVGLDSRSGTFSFVSAVRKVSLEEIARHWSGVYTILVPLPKGVPGNVHIGDKGPAIEWIRKQLAQIQGKSELTDAPRVFDAGLENQIKVFQLTHGLMPDGAVGTRTLIRICVQADKSAPRLTLTQAGK